MKLFNVVSSLMLFVAVSSQAAMDVRPGGSASALTTCGGKVYATASAQGSGDQVNVRYEDVSGCDTATATGKTFPMQGKPGRQKGSLTLKKSWIQTGFNYIPVTFSSSRSGRSETVFVYFAAYVEPGRSAPVQVDAPHTYRGAPAPAVGSDY